MEVFGRKITIVVTKVESVKVDCSRNSTAEDIAFVELNNTFLAVERGVLKLTRGVVNRLSTLIDTVYPYSKEPMMNEYWYSECSKLSGWSSF